MWSIAGELVDEGFLNTPAKDLTVRILDAKEGYTKSGYQSLELILDVVSGQFKGLKLPKIIIPNIPPSGDKKGTLWRLKSLASACGLFEILDGVKVFLDFTPDDFVGKIFICDFIAQSDPKYKDITNFRSYQEDFNKEVALLSEVENPNITSFTF